jgi:lauroyl/myristoyl acyltransferase
VRFYTRVTGLHGLVLAYSGCWFNFRTLSCVCWGQTGQRFPLFLKRRESIARKNIELCFPQYNAEEREKLIAENFKSIGMALLETGMAWFWPDERVRKWFDVEGLDNLKRAQMQNAA